MGPVIAFEKKRRAVAVTACQSSAQAWTVCTAREYGRVRGSKAGHRSSDFLKSGSAGLYPISGGIDTAPPRLECRSTYPLAPGGIDDAIYTSGRDVTRFGRVRYDRNRG